VKFSVEVQGAAELERALAALGPEATRVGRIALRKQANDLRDKVRAAAPVGEASTVRRRTTKRGLVRIADYGRLRDNIKTREERARADNAVVMAVTTGNAFWGRFLEFGTRKMSARPFFRPVWDNAKPGIVQALTRALGAGIERKARQLARRARG
jgi:HK97 gp10 family phage protein